MSPSAHEVDEPCARVRGRLRHLDAVPLPGSGHTWSRWQSLAELGRKDLSLTRIAEGHVDARAILIELDRSDLLVAGQLLGVWAADPEDLHAARTHDGWRLQGAKRWCSGSMRLDRALVTVTADDGPRLFCIDPRVADAEPGSWEPMGMVSTASHRLTFDDVAVPVDAAIGAPGAYVARPGFGHGGCGVAACWWGGALGVVDELRRAVIVGAPDDTAAALGRSVADLTGAGHGLRAAARAIDDDPHDLDLAVRLAAEVRLVVEQAARTALDRTVAALGASGLCQMPSHSQRVADLTVYLSQLPRFRAEASFGRLTAGRNLGIPW
ncbi:MAG: acyl-CoA dehydrogenase [Acidimicrobiales bacterium]